MEKFVTDLDKLLDDFETSDENLKIEVYDSSGYNSLRVSSDLNVCNSQLDRVTPTPLQNESSSNHESVTPTTTINGSPKLIIESHVSSDEFINGYKELSTLDLPEEPQETTIIEELLTDKPDDTCISFKSITTQNEKRRTVESLGLEPDIVVSPSPNHSHVPPRKKLRPNSLIGLSSVTTDIISEEGLAVTLEFDDEQQGCNRARRPQSLNICEDIIENCILNDVTNDDDAQADIDVPTIVVDEAGYPDSKDSISSLQNPATDSIDRMPIDDTEVWQGIPVDELGLREPIWISDETSDACMQCQMAFSIFRRRHHCRACGRLLCNKCCCWRMQLRFSSGIFPKDRVCAVCFQYLVRVEAARKHGQNIKTSNLQPLNSALKSNRPSSLAISPNSMSSSIQIGPEYLEASLGLKSVMFADGIRPGGDLTESEKSRIITPTKFQTPPQVKSIDLTSPEPISREPSLIDDIDDSYFSLEIKEKLLQQNGDEGTISTKQGPTTGGGNNFLIFPITKNLSVHLQLIHLPYCSCGIKNCVIQKDCDCDTVECWFFASIGLETIGIEEIVIILKRLPEEVHPPLEILKYYFQVYQKAFKNETKFDNMEMSVELFSESISLKEWAGILHIRPTFQCLNKLPILRSPFLIGILIHRWEFPWAILLPLRLILALGNQSRFYPCSIVSDRDRPPVYGEVGQTILQLVSPIFAFSNNLERGLCDSSIVPAVPGMWLHLLVSQETILQIPKTAYTHLLNILSCRKSDSCPLALAASFSREADSHLVCCQNEETGQYYSRAISIQNTERVVTGSTMILFIPRKDNDEHGTTIVEDAIVVNLSQMHLNFVINSLKTMADLALQCGSCGDSDASKSMVKIAWTESRQMSDIASVDRSSFVTDETIQSALGSLRDGGDQIIKSYRVPSSLQNMSLSKANQSNTNLKFVWTRFHLVESGNAATDSMYEDPVDYVEIVRELSVHFANAIIPFLELLRDMKIEKIGLRTKIGNDNVKWFCGCSRKSPYICSHDQSPIEESESRNNSYISSRLKNDRKIHFNNVEALPEVCIDYLNEFLVPFIYSKTTLLRNGSLISELEFHIIN